MPDSSNAVIIGAGPSGLSAALEMSKNGLKPIILEKGDHVGGLMHSPVWNDFILDIGRKELYSRIPEISALWETSLGDQYQEYPHRVGSLYKNKIVETSSMPRGMLRGVPFPWLVIGTVSLLAYWLKSAVKKPGTYEEFWHARTGSFFAKVFAQGYWEKFRGVRWSDMPLPEAEGGSHSTNIIKQTTMLVTRGTPAAQTQWRHPKRGAGQIFDLISEQVLNAGGKIQFGSEVTQITNRSDGTFDIDVSCEGKINKVRASSLISSLSIEALTEMLAKGDPNGSTTLNDGLCDNPAAQRNVILVYLFFTTPPKFPHAWIEVNDPNLTCGRIVNFAAFNGDMVPRGKTCLCVEFFCQSGDPVLDLSDDELVALAFRECNGANLADASALMNSQVIRKRRTNAAASWREQQDRERAVLLEKIRPLKNLFHVNRPGSDWASYAGLLAGRAVVTNDRSDFDLNADPSTRLEENNLDQKRTKGSELKMR